jgi:uncharacterized membrane protein YuzA (DUF378 family)
MKMKLDFIALILVVIGGLNWGLYGSSQGRYNLVKTLGNYTHPAVSIVVYILVGISAIWLAFKRDTYLPFLGTTVMPCPVLVERVPEGANTIVEVKVTPNSNVVFWASESQDKRVINTPQEAYGTYANSGVARSNSRGIATLRVRKPVRYQAGMRTLPLHIHYRICENGLMGRIETVYL